MRLRNIQVMAVCAAIMAASMPSGASAVPISGAMPGGAVDANPLLHDARVFCYNRSSGRFLHWGHCRRSTPRVYCSRRGRFLHWGSCWR